MENRKQGMGNGYWKIVIYFPFEQIPHCIRNDVHNEN
jgi:hypothetical protein